MVARWIWVSSQLSQTPTWAKYLLLIDPSNFRPSSSIFAFFVAAADSARRDPRVRALVLQ
jgi:hypothetical protein